MVPFAGYAMPVQYEGIIAEHLWTREHAGLFDVSHMGQLLSARRRASAAALEALLPGDIVGLEAGADALLAAARRGRRHPRRPDGHRARAATRRLLHRRQRRDQVGRHRLPARAPARRDHAQPSRRPGAAGAAGPEGGRRRSTRHACRASPTRADLHAGRPRATWNGVHARRSAARATPARTGSRSRSRRADADGSGRRALRPARGEADRPRRARFAAARGRAAALRPRPRRRRSTRSSAGLGFAISKRRRAEGGFPGAERILRAARRRPAAHAASACCSKAAWRRAKAPRCSPATARGRRRDLGRLLAEPERPDRDGLRRRRAWPRPAPRSSSTVRGRRSPPRSSPLPFVPHRYHRRGAAA